MALAIAGTVISAFGTFAVLGASSFAAPWWVHAHAVASMGWIAFYVVQNTLVFSDRIAWHRRLGRIGVALAICLASSDLAFAYFVTAAQRLPPMLPPSYLLALNWMNVLTFSALFGAAILLRRRTDWHRRLMLCATICLIAPALGRVLILFEARTHLNFTLFVMAWIAIGAIFDFATRRRVHPAYLWGLGAIAAMSAAVVLLTGLPPFAAFADAIAA